MSLEAIHPKALLKFTKEYLAHKFDPNDLHFLPDGETLLTLIIKNSEKDPQHALSAIKLLLDAGANVELENRKGEFPLYLAAKLCQCEIGKFLLAHQANPHRTYQGDKLGNIAFTYEAAKKIKRHLRLSNVLPHTGLFNKEISLQTQKELLALSKALGYKTKKEGVCHAIAMMTIQAALIEGGLDTFQERIKRIHAHSVEQLMEFINAAKIKRKQLYSAAKIKYSNLYASANASMIETELDKWQEKDNDEKYQILSPQQKLLKLISIRANAETYAALTKEEKIDIDIEAFFDGIEVHQKSREKEIKQFIIKRNLFVFDDYNVFHQRDIATTSSVSLEDNWAYIGATNGVYSINELETIFKSLREILRVYFKEIAGNDKKSQSFIPPLAIHVSGANHAIAVVYDFRKDEWTLTNVNNFSVDSRHSSSIFRATSSEVELANWMMDSIFSDAHSNIAICTSFYTTSDYVTPMFECINQWKKTDEYTKLHAITLERMQRKTKQKKSWWDIADRSSDIDTLEKMEKIRKDRTIEKVLLALALVIGVCGLTFLGLAIAFPPAIPFLIPLGIGVSAVSLGLLTKAFSYNKLKNANAKKADSDPDIANAVEEFHRWDEEDNSVLSEPLAIAVQQQVSNERVYKPSRISMFNRTAKFTNLSVTEKQKFLNDYLDMSKLKKAFVLSRQDKVDKNKIKECIKEHEDEVRVTHARLR